MYGYRVFESCVPDQPDRTSYGLELWRYEDGNNERLAVIPDISLHKNPLLLLAIRCTAGQLDPIHLRDVLDDFFSNV